MIFCDQYRSTALTNAHGINPMVLRIMLGTSVKLRSSTGPKGERSIQILEGVSYSVPCRIDTGRVCERDLGMAQDFLEPCRVVFQEYFDTLGAFFLITRSARESEIADAVCSTSTLWDDMLHFQRSILSVTRRMFFPIFRGDTLSPRNLKVPPVDIRPLISLGFASFEYQIARFPRLFQRLEKTDIVFAQGF